MAQPEETARRSAVELKYLENQIQLEAENNPWPCQQATEMQRCTAKGLEWLQLAAQGGQRATPLPPVHGLPPDRYPPPHGHTGAHDAASQSLPTTPSPWPSTPDPTAHLQGYRPSRALAILIKHLCTKTAASIGVQLFMPLGVHRLDTPPGKNSSRISCKGRQLHSASTCFSS